MICHKYRGKCVLSIIFLSMILSSTGSKVVLEVPETGLLNSEGDAEKGMIQMENVTTPGTGILLHQKNDKPVKEVAHHLDQRHIYEYQYKASKGYVENEDESNKQTKDETGFKGKEKENSENVNKTSIKKGHVEKDTHFPEIHFPFGKVGHIIFPAIIAFYLFLCLTIVCDCFLVPTVQALSMMMDLSLDVAGATLMAAASSSPEFFINLLATFLTKSDVGVGTVIGSGLYALLIVPALCILLSPNKVLRVDYWPLTRDSFAYLVSILLLVITLADGKVHWYEAATFIIAYFLYLIALSYSNEMRYYLETLFVIIRRRRYARFLDEPIWPLLQKPVRPAVSMSVEDIFYVLEDHKDHVPEFYTMGEWPRDSSTITKIQWLLMWPIINVLRLTIPTFWDSRLYAITFGMCVAWIGVLCYCIAWMMVIIGDAIHVPDTVMGLTLLAAGMSIPETISGIVVSKQGYGTMALCNALGSNTFSVLIGLGVPWLVKVILFHNGGKHLLISSAGIQYSACAVLVALILVFATFYINKFRLRTKVGLFYLISYLIFIVISIYIELQYFWLSERSKK